MLFQSQNFWPHPSVFLKLSQVLWAAGGDKRSIKLFAIVKVSESQYEKYCNVGPSVSKTAHFISKETLNTQLLMCRMDPTVLLYCTIRM